MPNEATVLNPQPPVLAYARLLIEIHQLILAGRGDSADAEEVADHMDAPWYAMTAQEQARMRGLAADLHTLRAGGPKRVAMDQGQLEEWKGRAREVWTRGEAGDIDAALSFFREPVPARLPAPVIPFLQARCWDRLGDPETALLFMKEADRLDPEQACYNEQHRNQLAEQAIAV